MSTILIADDNSNIRNMVTSALKDQGIEVIAVGNGEAAVRKLQDLVPDLVLADVFMPVRNGYEVCEFVKRDTRLAHVPVVLLTGAFDPFDQHEAERVGANGVLKKPFVPPEPLVNLVKSLLLKPPEPPPAPALLEFASNSVAGPLEPRLAAGSLAPPASPAPAPPTQLSGANAAPSPAVPHRISPPAVAPTPFENPDEPLQREEIPEMHITSLDQLLARQQAIAGEEPEPGNEPGRFGGLAAFPEWVEPDAPPRSPEKNFWTPQPPTPGPLVQDDVPPHNLHGLQSSDEDSSFRPSVFEAAPEQIASSSHSPLPADPIDHSASLASAPVGADLPVVGPAPVSYTDSATTRSSSSIQRVDTEAHRSVGGESAPLFQALPWVASSADGPVPPWPRATRDVVDSGGPAEPTTAMVEDQQCATEQNLAIPEGEADQAEDTTSELPADAMEQMFVRASAWSLFPADSQTAPSQPNSVQSANITRQPAAESSEAPPSEPAVSVIQSFESSPAAIAPGKEQEKTTAAERPCIVKPQSIAPRTPAVEEKLEAGGAEHTAIQLPDQFETSRPLRSDSPPPQDADFPHELVAAIADRVTERLRPQVVELISGQVLGEVLRPIVERLVRRELDGD